MKKLKPFNLFNELVNFIKHFFFCFGKTKLRWSIVIPICLVLVLFPLSIEFFGSQPSKRHSKFDSRSFVVLDNFCHFGSREQGPLCLQGVNELGEYGNEFVNVSFSKAFAVEPIRMADTNQSQDKRATYSKKPKLSRGEGDSNDFHLLIPLVIFPNIVSGFMFILWCCFIHYTQQGVKKMAPVDDQFKYHEDFKPFYNPEDDPIPQHETKGEMLCFDKDPDNDVLKEDFYRSLPMEH